MAGYELLCVVRPDLEEEKIDQVYEKLKKTLTGKGATILADEKLGKRELMTPMQKFTSGYYLRLEFEANGEAVKELKRVIKVTDSILREMCVRLESIRDKDKKEEPVA